MPYKMTQQSYRDPADKGISKYQVLLKLSPQMSNHIFEISNMSSIQFNINSHASLLKCSAAQ